MIKPRNPASIRAITTNSVPIHFYWHNRIVQMLACLLGVSFELCQRDDCQPCESMRNGHRANEVARCVGLACVTHALEQGRLRGSFACTLLRLAGTGVNPQAHPCECY